MHFEDGGALLIFFALLGRAFASAGDGNTAFLRNDANGFWKSHLFHFHNEFEDVAADLAAEAVIDLLDGMHREGRRFLRVKGAESGEVLAALF